MSSNTLRERFTSLHFENRPFINGAYRITRHGQWLPKYSPIDGRSITPIPICDEHDVDFAVQCAQATFIAGTWMRKSVAEKKAILYRLADLIEVDIPNLAYLDTLETGRPYRNFVEDSIPKAVNALRWFTESIDKFYEDYISNTINSLAFVTHEPLGVVGVIAPWNDPLVIALWKITPALLMGNSVIIKPAEQSTFSTLRIAAMAKEAGVPDGVLNVLTGPGEITGQALARHPLVRGIFFTGSSEIGKRILCYSGESNMKKVGLECGGKGAFIVTDHCNQLENAARTLARNMFYNQGQICSAPSRLFLHEAIRDRFLSLLAEQLPAYVPAPPFAEETRVGAIISNEQYSRVCNFIQIGMDAGYPMLRPELPASLTESGGYYLAPTVFVDVPVDSPLATEEIFGPVLVTSTFTTLSEAINQTNNSRYGLAAAIWSDQLDEALATARALQVGLVHINSYGEDDMSTPFGGIKESGLGKDKSLHAFDDYAVLKTTWVKIRPEV